jgi:gamma-glutamyltranspeptidase/glutathione hydrolase
MKAIKLLGTFMFVAVLVGRPTAQTTWRPAIYADHGMVAAGHALASEAGLSILKAGGNAIDAAVAAWFVQGLVEPNSTGLGGDMFILSYDAEADQVRFINGSGTAPSAATVDFYESKGGLPPDGPLSVNIPGAVASALMAIEQYGSKPLSEVLAPAIEMAEGGVPVSPHLAGSLARSADKLSRYPSTAKIWFEDGKPLEAGDRVIQKDIGGTLRTIAREGVDAFYRGPIAKQAVSYLEDHDGIHTEPDWASYRAYEDTPIKITYRGIDVYECPPNSQGHVMLQALKILEGFNLRYMGHNSASYLHVVTEALKLGFADRNKWVGDPKFVPPIPMAGLLSEEYAAERRKLIDPWQAIEGEAPAGNPRGQAPSDTVAYAGPQPMDSFVDPYDDEAFTLTTYLTVVDKDRNMVSITSSLLSGFGSGMVVDGAGFFLNNRMAYFGLEPDDINVLVPGKRVRQTINPALALKDGKPFVTFGTPGADTQPQTQLQFFLNLVEFNMNVQEALEQPTVISTSFRRSYYPHEVAGTLLTPVMLPQHVRDELAAMGHLLDVREARGAGAVKAIVIHPKTNVLMGGVSPTRDSYVMAW